MKLKMLQAKVLKKEELKQIHAGVAPDCEPGEIVVHIPGTGLVCRPSSCGWEILDLSGDTSGGETDSDDSRLGLPLNFGGGL
ncbi:hypothetical protein [Tenacibaculum sp. M341]|uniref:hypothetical protein n=1 Tax=Tenacibaculum sp. M341 TaxID=2530339 RepID=UPI001048A8F4|nr:hypothetical protein [Tenacibaculum sp. M341]TCI91812.1 hypothetical protein EYW44_09675 [Tenacibaculum sp. M341]